MFEKEVGQIVSLGDFRIDQSCCTGPLGYLKHVNS